MPFREYFKAISPVVIVAAVFLTIWAAWHFGNFHIGVHARQEITEQDFRFWVIFLLAANLFRGR